MKILKSMFVYSIIFLNDHFIYSDTLFGVIFMPSMITVFLFYKYNNFNIESKFQKGMEFCSMMFNLEQCLALSRLSIFLRLNERNGDRSLALQSVIMNSWFIYYRTAGYHFSRYITGCILKTIIWGNYIYMIYYKEQSLFCLDFWVFFSVYDASSSSYHEKLHRQ